MVPLKTRVAPIICSAGEPAAVVAETAAFSDAPGARTASPKHIANGEVLGMPKSPELKHCDRPSDVVIPDSVTRGDDDPKTLANVPMHGADPVLVVCDVHRPEAQFIVICRSHVAVDASATTNKAMPSARSSDLEVMT